MWPKSKPICASKLVSNSHLFHSKSIDLPIPKIWLLKIWPWPWKRARSWVTSKFKVTTRVQHPIESHPFDSMSIHTLITMVELFFKIWPLKSKVKAIAQGHIVGMTSYRLISLFVPCWSALPFVGYSYFKIDLENPRLRSWVRSKFKVTMWV